MEQFVALFWGILGNYRAEKYVELVETMKNQGKMGCRISINVHTLDNHLDHFKNLNTDTKDSIMRI